MFSRTFNSKLLHVHCMGKCIDAHNKFDFCFGLDNTDVKNSPNLSEHKTKLLHVHCMGKCIDKNASDVKELEISQNLFCIVRLNFVSGVEKLKPNYSRCMEAKFLGCM